MRLTKFWSEPQSFEPLEFTPGLNIILAHITDQSRAIGSGSRNGAGKTTFTKVLSFCLLDVDEGDGIASDGVFKPYTFFLEFVHRDVTYIISRSPQSHKTATLCVNNGQPRTYGIGELRERLSDLFFGAPEQRGSISIKSLLPYFIRQESQGFANIFHPSPMSKPAWQANTLFLMGLDHRLPGRLSALRKKQEEASQRKRALEAHLNAKGHPQPIEVRLQLQQAEGELKHRQHQLAQYQVGQEYRYLTNDGASITRQMKRLVSERYSVAQRIAEYRNLLDRPIVAALDVRNTLDIFAEVEIHFPQQLKRSLDEVLEFQHALVENRRRFLEQEVKALQRTMAELDVQVDDLAIQKRRIMSALKEQGQLEEYDVLTGALDNLRTRIAQLQTQAELFSDADRQRQTIIELDAQISQLALESRLHIMRNQDVLRSLNSRFASYFQRLYGHSATLIVDVEKDFAFEVRGQGKELDSSGRYRTAVFCYDLALLMGNRKRDPFAHWLVHDGPFNGVDTEKVAECLAMASQLPDDVQYICTINSDSIPKGRDFKRYVRREIADSPSAMTFMKQSF